MASRLDILTTVGNLELLQRSGDTIVGISTAALASLIESAGIPFPAVEGTEGQVLVIATTDPTLETAWANASAPVDAAIAAYDAETAVHGIADTTALLDTADIGTNVQPYGAGVPNSVFYTEATASTAVRPDWDGPVFWFNTDGQTDPADAELNDPIIKPVP